MNSGSGIASEFCALHPERPAVSRCGSCGKPLCDSCLRQDVALELAFCSTDCSQRYRAGSQQAPQQDNARLLLAMGRPYRNGFFLWWRSLPALALRISPLLVLIGGAFHFGVVLPNAPPGTPLQEIVAPWFLPVVLACFFFGIALTGVVLSRNYLGTPGNDYLLTLKGFVPWLLTWAAVLAIASAGILALILPGIYLSIRLFWADELSLIHGKWPLSALKESWQVTDRAFGELFLFQFLNGLFSYAVTIGGIILFLPLGLGLALTGLNHRIVLFPLLALVYLVLYGLVHGPELVKFYGMRARRATAGSG